MNEEFFKISWRIKPVHWETDRQFLRLREFLHAHRGVVSEIALFVGNVMSWHGYTKPETDKSQFALAARRMEELRKDGFLSVGFNLWPTFGSEGESFNEELLLPPMAGFDGTVSKHVICPSSAQVVDYLVRRFILLAEKHPDFIWVDDDLRMAHLGVPYPCFCKTCLSGFANGKWSGRLELVAALNDPPNTVLREDWIHYNAFRLERVCAHVEKAVHQVDASIDLGLMTVGPTHTSYSGDYIKRCMNTLNGRRGRPGHGFYVDESPRDILRKAMDVGWQLAEYPGKIRDIQYEFEDWPSISLEKANTVIAAEVAIAAGVGCNGVAFSIFPTVPNSFVEYEPLMKMLEHERPSWRKLSQAAAALSSAGLWLPWTPLFMARRMVNGKWFQESAQPLIAPLKWCEFGIPLTADRSRACGTILAGDAAEVFTTEELKGILSGPVLMDVPALAVIASRGLASLTGVTAKEEINGAYERLSENKVNGNYIGEERNTTFSSGWTLAVTNTSLEVFSELLDINGIVRGPCLTGYVNELGGRVVVMGYKPWERIGTPPKLSQIHHVVDWATDNRMPVRMDTPGRIAVFVRTNATATRLTAVLLNHSYDEINNVSVILRTAAKRIEWLDAAGQSVPLRIERKGGECQVILERMPAWHTAILIGS